MLTSRCSPVEPKLGTKRMNRQSCRRRWACTLVWNTIQYTTPLSQQSSQSSNKLTDPHCLDMASFHVFAQFPYKHSTPIFHPHQRLHTIPCFSSILQESNLFFEIFNRKFVPKTYKYCVKNEI